MKPVLSICFVLLLNLSVLPDDITVLKSEGQRYVLGQSVVGGYSYLLDTHTGKIWAQAQKDDDIYFQAIERVDTIAQNIAIDSLKVRKEIVSELFGEN